MIERRKLNSFVIIMASASEVQVKDDPVADSRIPMRDPMRFIKLNQWIVQSKPYKYRLYRQNGRQVGLRSREGALVEGPLENRAVSQRVRLERGS